MRRKIRGRESKWRRRRRKRRVVVLGEELSFVEQGRRGVNSKEKERGERKRGEKVFVQCQSLSVPRGAIPQYHKLTAAATMGHPF